MTPAGAGGPQYLPHKVKRARSSAASVTIAFANAARESHQGDMAVADDRFVVGVDLDGCVADFLATMKVIFAEWSGQRVEDLDPEPSYGFPEWGLDPRQYERLHRFAVTQRDMFLEMRPVAGAPQA